MSEKRKRSRVLMLQRQDQRRAVASPLRLEILGLFLDRVSSFKRKILLKKWKKQLEEES